MLDLIAGVWGDLQKIEQSIQKKIDEKRRRFIERSQFNIEYNQTVSDLEAERFTKEQVERAIADIRSKMEQERNESRKRTVIIFATIIVLLVLLILLLN